MSGVECTCPGAKSSLPKCFFPGTQSHCGLLGPKGTLKSPAPHFTSVKKEAEQVVLITKQANRKMGAGSWFSGAHVLFHPRLVAAEEFLLYRFRENSLVRRGRELEAAFAYNLLLKLRRYQRSASKNEVLMELEGRGHSISPNYSFFFRHRRSQDHFVLLKSPRSSLSYATQKTFVLSLNIS